MSIAEGRRPAGLRGLIPRLLRPALLLVLLLLLGACLEEAEDKCFKFNNVNDPNRSSECTGGEGGTFGNVVIANVNPLNEEVLLINQGTLAEIMTSWTLENDTTGLPTDIFPFPPFTLLAGNVVTIDSQDSASNPNTAIRLFWDGGANHWNPSDTVVLKDELGALVDSCVDGVSC